MGVLRRQGAPLADLTRLQARIHVTSLTGGDALQGGRVPKYLPSSTPSRILFVGRAVRLLQRPTQRLAQEELLPQQQVLEWAAQLRALQAQPVFSSIAFERCVNRIHDQARVSHLLSFHACSLTVSRATVRLIVHSQVSEALYGLMVNEAQLLSHLGALKDFMLLCRGDLFHAFLEEGADLLRLPPREATAAQDVLLPFHQVRA